MSERREDGVEALGHAAWDVIRRMTRELLARKPGGHLVEANLERLDLRLALVLQGDGAGPGPFAERLARAIDQVLDDAIQHAAAFRPGHAFCHRCESSTCEHSAPPSCRQIFAGYGVTGLPRWEDFAQHCLQRKHPEVDRLYDDPPALVTLVQERSALQRGLLPAYRRNRCEIAGQVVAGFYPVHARNEDGRGVVALTLQAAVSRNDRGAVRVGLNLLGRTPAGEPLDTLWDRRDDLPWRRAVRWAQSALQTLDDGRSRRGLRRRSIPPEALYGRIEGIMRGLARRLERDQRSRSRRTRHAERRHSSGTRPTRKALEDARSAGDESFMVDERSGALVVLGDRGRTHFFAEDGQLVSSVRYSRDAIARKIRIERWRRASADEREVLRRQVSDPAPEERGGVSEPPGPV